MTPEQCLQLADLRRLLAESYKDYHARCPDVSTRSDEGYVEIHYGSMIQDPQLSTEIAVVRIYSSVFGPSRQSVWERGTGRSSPSHQYVSDPMASALLAVEGWHREQLSRTYECYESDW